MSSKDIKHVVPVAMDHFDPPQVFIPGGNVTYLGDDGELYRTSVASLSGVDRDAALAELFKEGDIDVTDDTIQSLGRPRSIPPTT